MKAYLLGTNCFLKRESIDDIRKAIVDSFACFEKLAECSIKCVYENTNRGIRTINVVMSDDSIFAYKIVE